MTRDRDKAYREFAASTDARGATLDDFFAAGWDAAIDGANARAAAAEGKLAAYVAAARAKVMAK